MSFRRISKVSINVRLSSGEQLSKLFQTLQEIDSVPFVETREETPQDLRENSRSVNVCERAGRIVYNVFQQSPCSHGGWVVEYNN